MLYTTPSPSVTSSLSSFSRDNISSSTRIPQQQPQQTTTMTSSSTSGPDSIFVVPFDYVPGKFPTSIREKTPSDDHDQPLASPLSMASTGSGRSTDSIPYMEEEVAKSAAAAGGARPTSIYDNLPDGGAGTTPQQLLDILQSPGIMAAERVFAVNDSGVFLSQDSLNIKQNSVPEHSIDDILEHTRSLQQMVKSWEEGLDRENEKEIAAAVPQFPLHSLDDVDGVSAAATAATGANNTAASLEVSMIINHSLYSLHYTTAWYVTCDVKSIK